MSTYVGQIKIGSGASSPIASSIYGVCTTPAATAIKEVSLANFDKELHGVTIFVYFTQGNSVISGAKLKVQGTGTYNIVGNCFCGADTVLGFTLDISSIDSTTHEITAVWRCVGNAPYISSTLPSAIGTTAALGTHAAYAREDHVHNIAVSAGASGSGEITVGGTTITLPLEAYAPKNNPTFTGVVTLPAIDNNSAGTSAATKDYVDTKLNASLGVAEAMVFKGTIGAQNQSPAPTVSELPHTGYKKGWTYKVITAATYADKTCEVGDLLIAINDGPASGSSVIDNDWTVAQGNIDSSLYKENNVFVNEHILLADGTNGKVKDSGSAIATSIAAASTSANIPTSQAVATFVEGKGYVTSSGVTNVATGIGLTTASGSAITSTGTIKAKLKSETALAADSAVGTETTNRNYAIVTDHSGYLAVSVPWTDTKVTQTGIETNSEFAILLKKTTGTTDETGTVNFVKTSGKLVTVNASTGILTAAGFSGALNGTDVKTALGTDANVTTDLTFLHKSGSWKTLSIGTIASIAEGVLTLNNVGLSMT